MVISEILEALYFRQINELTKKYKVFTPECGHERILFSFIKENKILSCPHSGVNTLYFLVSSLICLKYNASNISLITIPKPLSQAVYSLIFW